MIHLAELLERRLGLLDRHLGVAQLSVGPAEPAERVAEAAVIARLPEELRRIEMALHCDLVLVVVLGPDADLAQHVGPCGLVLSGLRVGESPPPDLPGLVVPAELEGLPSVPEGDLGIAERIVVQGNVGGLLHQFERVLDVAIGLCAHRERHEAPGNRVGSQVIEVFAELGHQRQDHLVPGHGVAVAVIDARPSIRRVASVSAAPSDSSIESAIDRNAVAQTAIDRTNQ